MDRGLLLVLSAFFTYVVATPCDWVACNICVCYCAMLMLSVWLIVFHAIHDAFLVEDALCDCEADPG